MKNLKLLWSFMKGNRLMYFGAIISIGLATLFSFFSPLVIRLTVDSIIGGKEINAPSIVLRMIEAVGGTTILAQNLWICGLLLILLSALNGIFTFLKGKWTAMAAETTARNIRNKLYNHLQHVHYDYHVKAETGDVLQRCTSDVDTIRAFLAVQFVEIGRALFMLTLSLTIMMSLDVRMTLISMIVVPFIFTFAIVFFMRVKKTFKASDEAEGRLSNVLQENLTGVRVVRAFARQDYEIDKFDEKNTDYRDLTYDLLKLLAGYWSSSDLLCMLQIGAVLTFGSYWASIGRISLGTLIVFITYESMLLWPVRQMGRILTDLGKSLVSLKRIEEILENSIEEPAEGEMKPEIKGEIEFKNVTFGYDVEKPILKNVSFKVKAGQTVAILGPTGSGKTSLVHLLPRLYDFNEGSITIDGIDIRKIEKKWLRKNIGIVLQEPFLYSKSIIENIGLAKDNALEEEVYHAAQTASVHSVIQEFEQGYETMVGERGVTLSGGQKQRVAIARTLILNSPVLIFDDSLSAVDTETDTAIRKALSQRDKSTTTFIISHRITTLSEADFIVVLDEGQVVQIGTHQELISQEGLYNRIWSIQNALEEESVDEL
ncbi:MAG: transporter [Clostridia bacterium]|nr:transporter [Clostridia bacterium]